MMKELMQTRLHRSKQELDHELVALAVERSREIAQQWAQPACRWEIPPLNNLLQDFPISELRAASDIAYSLGLVQLELGDIGSAEKLVLAVQRIDSATLPADHPSRGATLNTLGRILWARGKVEEAESCMRRAIDLARSGNEEAKTGLAIRLNNLAQMLKESGKLTEAKPLFREALALQEQSEGKDGRHVAECLHNLSGLTSAAGRYDEAEAFLLRAVAIEEKILPSNHPNRALRLIALSRLAESNGRVTKACSLASNALQIAEQCFGSRSGNLLPFLFRCINTTSDTAVARELRLRTLAVSPYGSQHRFEETLVGWLDNLHTLIQSDIEATDPQSIIHTALDATRCPDAESGMVFLHCRACLAIALVDLGKPNDAIAVLHATTREAEFSGFALSLDFADGLATVANRLRNLDKDSEAAELFFQVLAIQESHMGANAPRLCSVLNNLGASLSDANRLAEAAAVFERALPLAVALVGMDSIDYATLTHNYLRVLMRLGSLSFMTDLIGSWYLERAEAMAIETYVATERHRERTGCAHPYQQDALALLRRIQAALGRNPEVATSRLRDALATRRSEPQKNSETSNK